MTKAGRGGGDRAVTDARVLIVNWTRRVVAHTAPPHHLVRHTPLTARNVHQDVYTPLP